jgi:hypothetical protein
MFLADTRAAGVATLTYAGEGLHQRTSASALRTLGLDLLIARSVLDYEALAVKLARHPKALTAIRLRLLCSRPLGNYSDINLSMCLPHRMAGEWVGEEEPRAEMPQHGRARVGLSQLWQTEKGVKGLETVLRLAHDAAVARRSRMHLIAATGTAL